MIRALRHVPHESMGLLEGVFERAGLSYEYIDLFRGDAPPFDPQRLYGLVVLGGPMNVDETEKYPFLAVEVEWIRAALAAELPVLGICLGSQLLAKAAGARVNKNPIKEIGWYDLQILPAAADDPLFAGCRATERVFQWHGDTFDLPTGAAHLARSPQCAHQAFRVGRSAWGLQFHLEVTAPIIESWLTEPGNCCEVATLDYIDPDAIRGQTPAELPAMTTLGERMFGAFARLCHDRGN